MGSVTNLMKKCSRRRLVAAMPALAVSLIAVKLFSWSAAAEERYDFNKMPEGWEVVSGKWGVEDIAGASGNWRALVQRATSNEFNVIVASAGPYTDIDVSVRFKPISGHE